MQTKFRVFPRKVFHCLSSPQLNEIDIEMTGNKNDSVQFTTHHPFGQSTTNIEPVAFNPHVALHDYVIEWTPGKASNHFSK